MARAHRGAPKAPHQAPSPWFTVKSWAGPDHIMHIVDERFVGSGKSRHAEFRTKLLYPERYHMPYHLPPGVENQPF